MNKINRVFQEELIQKLEIPDSAYEKAEERYKDIGRWLGREDSSCRHFAPYIFPQGSFRLGTVIRPSNSNDDFDLDLSCEFMSKITKDSFTQFDLKALLGEELDLYRKARGIKQILKEKHRCWRLEYSDYYNFHIDIVPCIPEGEIERNIIKKAIQTIGQTEQFASKHSDLTVTITDDRHRGFRQICADWEVSNPQGYAEWFEGRMRLANEYLTKRAQMLKSVKIEDLPQYKWKSPLQIVIQLLKRHRDTMFKEDLEIKPISIIITTLAAQAYNGEVDVFEAVSSVLANMNKFVNNHTPRIPNPVNPNEDFSERWSTTEGKKSKLEDNFWLWLAQAKVDFAYLKENQVFVHLEEKIREKFSVIVDSEKIRKSLGIIGGSHSTIILKEHIITEPSRPWSKGY